MPYKMCPNFAKYVLFRLRVPKLQLISACFCFLLFKLVYVTKLQLYNNNKTILYMQSNLYRTLNLLSSPSPK